MRLPLTLATLLLLPLAAGAQPAPRAPARAPAAPAAPAFACPPHIRVTPEQRIEAPAPWRVQTESQMHWLRGAELFDGEPSERVQLREDGDNRQQRSAWWDMNPANPRGHFIVCRYEGVEAGIVARVPEGLRRCTVQTFREDSRGVRHGRIVIGPDNWVRVTCN